RFQPYQTFFPFRFRLGISIERPIGEAFCLSAVPTLSEAFRLSESAFTIRIRGRLALRKSDLSVESERDAIGCAG
ncbi:hypothetical protein ACWEFL_33445, partial [Streptomyces sp. NPDC004838]